MITDHRFTLKDIVLNRRSIRRFKSDPVPRDLILDLIDAARLAPSASNRQPCRYYVVADEVAREKLRSSGAILQKFVLEAPVCIVCCADMSLYSDEKTKEAIKELTQAGGMPGAGDPGDIASYWNWWHRVVSEKDLIKLAYLDVGIAVEHIVLMAVATGLGTCWMRRINEAEVARALDLPPEVVVVSLLALGYPAEDPKPRPRKDLKTFLLNPDGF
jgi:nitroreductase